MPKLIVNKEGLKILKTHFGRIYFGKIYRYMKIDSIRASLENGTLRYTDPKNFNDPLDCSYLTVDHQNYLDGFIERNKEKLVLEFSLLMLKKAKDQHKDSKIFSSLIEIMSSPEFIKDKELNQIADALKEPLSHLLKDSKESIKTFGSDFKICCFSKTYDSPQSFLMWSHYADSHKGACFEFDMNSMLLDAIEKYSQSQDNLGTSIFNYLKSHTMPITVKYKSQIPKTKLDSDKNLHSWISTKSRIWSYEKEVRCIIESSNKFEEDEKDSENIPFPFEYLTKIIFGCLTPEVEIKNIKKIIGDKYSKNNIQFEKMQVDPSTFNLITKSIT